jgi:cytochrome c-type biogenesis protein CcmH/NrfG
MFRSVKERLGKVWKPVFRARRVSAAPKVEDASIRKRLLEIRQLLDEGLITQAEFEQKRADILSKI